MEEGNVTDVSKFDAKALEPIVVTDEGNETEVSALLAKAVLSIVLSIVATELPRVSDVNPFPSNA
jgi:hypothetical protein